MSAVNHEKAVCVIIGASHGGVNLAFALRRLGWLGAIHLFDADPELPYHRPPLSKGFITGEGGVEDILLKPAEQYEQEQISLFLGTAVASIDRAQKQIVLADGKVQRYDKLVLATGGAPLIPPIAGIAAASQLYPLRSARDAADIRAAMARDSQQRVVIIGGGYIGLETAASLRKIGAEVTVLEREERVLARVTAPEMSQFFLELHAAQGVKIFTSKNVTEITMNQGVNQVVCADGSRFSADIIVVGVGIRVNDQLAKAAGLVVENGIRVDADAGTSDADIFAVGDCTWHHNQHYDRFIRLESVQNAVDQAKVAAAAIVGEEPVYDTIPWFWSDQYAVKLQMVGLAAGYDQALVRKEEREHCFSIWYFLDETLLAVDAVNNGKAYILGGKFIKGGQRINKEALIDATIPFKPGNLILA